MQSNRPFQLSNGMMMIPKARSRARYSRIFKDQVTRRILNGECTLTVAAAESKISKGVLSKWVKSARSKAQPFGNPDVLDPAHSQTGSVADLQARIMRLESSLETLRKILADSFANRTLQRFPPGMERS